MRAERNLENVLQEEKKFIAGGNTEIQEKE